MQDGAEVFVMVLDVKAAEQAAAERQDADSAEHERRLSHQAQVMLVGTLYKAALSPFLFYCNRQMCTPHITSGAGYMKI